MNSASIFLRAQRQWLTWDYNQLLLHCGTVRA